MLFFPILSAIGAVVLFIGIIAPKLFVSGGYLSVPLLIVWYFTASFVSVFMNAALILCVKKRLQGGNPTISYGLKEASKHILPIIGWSLISTTVGLILHALEDRAENNFLARIVIGLIGMAWSLATFFALPVIVIEGKDAFSAISRSASLLKKTWGEQIIATMGIGIAFFWFYVLGVLALIASLFILPPGFAAVMIGLVILYFLVVALIQVTLSSVFNATLYSYAVGDNIPSEFKRIAGQVFAKKSMPR